MILMRKKSNKALRSVAISSILALVLILSVLQLAGVVNLFPFAESDYNTGINPSTINYMETEHHTFPPWQPTWSGNTYGIWTELIQDNANDPIVTSYRSDPLVLSESISCYGVISYDPWAYYYNPHWGWYQVDIMTDPSSGWINIMDDGWTSPTYIHWVSGSIERQSYGWTGQQADYFDIPPVTFKIKGQIVGALRVKQMVRGTDAWGTVSTHVASTDYVYLISGDGCINIEGHNPQDVPMFEIGETVPIYVSADYSGHTVGGNGRWQLWAFPLRGGPGRMLNEWTYDYFRETYYWELPPDAWVRCEGIGCDSNWRLELHNTLFLTDSIIFATIDIRANAPPTPTILTSPDIPQVGQDISITMSANTNINTHNKIIKFIVRGVYTDNNYQFVYKDVMVDAGTADPYTASTTIHPPRAGQFRLQVWAHDSPSGRQSEIPGEKIIEMHVGNYRLTMIVIDQYNSLPIEGVKVEKIGGSDEIKYTNPQGQCWFDLDQGTFSFQFTKKGYRAESKSFSVTSDKEETIPMTRTTSTWDLTVTVKTADADTVWGATVKVGGTERLTTEDGSVTFTDVAEGDYTVTASKGTLSGKKEVNLDRTRDIDIIIREGGIIPPIELDDYLWYIVGGGIAIVVLFGVMYYLKLRKVRGTGKKKGPGLIDRIFKGKKKR